MTSYHLMAEVRSTRVEDVCRRLAGRILAKDYEKGSWLPSERRLAEELGVSRTVMREATRQLQSEGLIRIFHGRGIQVVNETHGSFERTVSRMVPDDVARLQQLVEARMLLEPEVAAMAAKRKDNHHIAQMREIQEAFRKADSSEEGVELDMDFHTALAEAAGNSVIRLMLDAIAHLGRESRLLTLTNYPIKGAQRDHDRILDAVEAGDGALARKRMHEHIAHASADLTSLMEQEGS